MAKTPLVALGVLTVAYLALVIPFFLSGLIFATVFSEHSRQIRSLYFCDLVGAAVGCVIFIPFIPVIGPGGLLFAAAGLCLVAAVMFLGRRRGPLTVAAVTAAILVTAMPFLRADGYFDFEEKMNKRGVMLARESGDVEVTRWDPIAKIQVINFYRTDDAGRQILRNRHVAYDGGSQSSRLYAFDGDYVRLRQELERDLGNVGDHFWNRTVFASHWLKADTGVEVLIIGSAAGQETKAALLFNPRSVDAVEMVGAVVDLSVNRYGDYIGNIFKDPRVNVRVGEGRTFLRSSEKKYDIIQIFSNHTSSSIASGSRATYPNYLQTVEAYVEYFSSLKDDGLLQINHHVYPRMIVTAAAAWKQLGRGDFRRHVVVYERKPYDSIPMFIVSMQPWTPETLARLQALMSRPGPEYDNYLLVEHPLDPSSSFLTDDAFSGTIPADRLDGAPYRFFPPTDDRPYFGFLRTHFGEVAPDPRYHLDQSTASSINWYSAGGLLFLPADIAHWIITGAAAILFGLVLVLVPLLFSRAGRARWPGEFTSLVYFSCLGAGFIIIELTLIQVFMKFIGYPLYTYTVVLFTMLLAAGVGSQAAEFLEVEPAGRWWLPFAGTLAFGAGFWLLHPWVFQSFMALDFGARVVVAAAMMFPMSFFMGMALPLGILSLALKPKGAVAWAWGMNGLFTTIGGIASGLLAMFLGFKVTILIGLVIYVVAALAFRRLGRLAALPAAA
jgi:spermidine synthase